MTEQTRRGLLPEDGQRTVLESFDRLEVDGPATVSFTAGGGHTLTIRAELADRERIKMSTGRTLKLKYKGGLLRGRSPQGPIHYEIGGTTLREIELAGKVDATFAGIDAKRLEIEVEGQCTVVIDGLTAVHLDIEIEDRSTVTVRGTADRQRVSVEGSSTYDASELICADTEIEASEASGARVHASQRLDAEAEGGATITYRGSPSVVKVDMDSGGSVTAASS